jgi:6-phosphofructokinase 1
MKVGLLTGGGDCPGLNAVIRAVVQRTADEGWNCLGILEGWRGLIRNLTMPLDVAMTDGIVGRGGTILGASRTNPYKNPEFDIPAVLENLQSLALDALVVIGGDDTLGVAHRLYKDYRVPIVGVPKTIDNDMLVTDFTFGFDTAINVVAEAVDRLRTTAESHRRVIVVETMGRNSGWIACFAGIAAAADYILVPEVPIDLAHLVNVLVRRRAKGKPYGIVVVSEGAEFPEQHAPDPCSLPLSPGPARFGSIAAVVACEIERRTGIETRCITLGHLQRGGSPSAFDRVLATRLGLAASHLVIQRRFGRIVALSENRIVEKPLDEQVSVTRTLDLHYYDEAAAFFK